MRGIILFVLLFAALAAGSHILSKKAATRRFLRGVLLTALLLEVVVFNFKSYHLWFGNYEKQDLPLSQATLTGFSKIETGKWELLKQGGSIEWRDLETRVGTITLTVTMPEDVKELTVTCDASDSTNAAYRVHVGTATLLKRSLRSHTFVMELSGTVTNLRLNLPSYKSSAGAVTLTGVTINEPVRFELSAVRLLLIFFISLGMWQLLRSEALSRPYAEESALTGRIAAIITFLFVWFSVSVTLCQTVGPGGLAADFRLTHGDQITQELVDAFEAGQVELLQKPSDDLLALENPYDWSARSAAGVTYLWDHCLYNGRYYSYYGIAPVLLLFLPYHLLTGYYFPTPEAVLLFSGVGMIFLTLLYLEFMKKFFPRIPARFAVCGLLLMHCVSGIGYCNLIPPLFYEIAQSSGFAFTTAGFYFLLSSNCIGSGKLSRSRICLASVCLSLAVLCRPTLAVYCIAALFFIGFGLSKCRSEVKTAERGRCKPVLTYLLAALLPFVVIGSVQMAYNYLRFDSVFDFGIQYSLTINDFTRSEYHFGFVLIGLYNYLLTIPQVNLEFPFIQSSFQRLSVNGYYFIANYSAVGIFFRALPTFSWFRAGTALKKLDKSKRLTAFLTIGVTCVLCPLVILWSIWESGYGARYCADFNWQILIGALAVAFFLWQSSENTEKKRLTSKVLVWSTFAACLVAFALNYAYVRSFNVLDLAPFERLFEFWK